MLTLRLSTLLFWTGGNPGEAASGLLARGAQAMRHWWVVVSTRKQLQDVDDRLLEDIGLSRRDRRDELSRAPWDVAARRQHEIGSGRIRPPIR